MNIFQKISCVFTLSLLTAFSSTSAHAEMIDYAIGDKKFSAYVSKAENPKATILIVHDWNGLDDYEKGRADSLAKLGYNAVAVDLFGVDAVLNGRDDYRRETGALYQNRDEFRARLKAAEDAASDIIGEGKSVLIGYCFGGSATLEAMRAGQKFDGFVSFHGGIATPEGQSYGASKSPLLILQGSQDPAAKLEVISSVFNELNEAGIPFNAEIYGGVRHAFTVPGANDYDANADAKSWQAFLAFLKDEI